VTPEVRTTDPDGIDYGWVMQVTFITTIFVGTPIVTVLSVFADLPTWPDRAMFAVRVGAAFWLVTLISVYVYARRYREPTDDSAEEPTAEPTETPSGVDD
jgi:membrane protein YdbS with pleckstrin-like domain